MSGEQLDISSDPARSNRQTDAGGRPYIGVQFDCCGIYSRVYVNPRGTAYEGRCPRCLRPFAVRIGPGGTSDRFFVAR